MQSFIRKFRNTIEAIKRSGDWTSDKSASNLSRDALPVFELWRSIQPQYGNSGGNAPANFHTWVSKQKWSEADVVHGLECSATLLDGILHRQSSILDAREATCGALALVVFVTYHYPSGADMTPSLQHDLQRLACSSNLATLLGLCCAATHSTLASTGGIMNAACSPGSIEWQQAMLCALAVEAAGALLRIAGLDSPAAVDLTWQVTQAQIVHRASMVATIGCCPALFKQPELLTWGMSAGLWLSTLVLRRAALNEHVLGLEPLSGDDAVLRVQNLMYRDATSDLSMSLLLLVFTTCCGQVANPPRPDAGTSTAASSCPQRRLAHAVCYMVHGAAQAAHYGLWQLSAFVSAASTSSSLGYAPQLLVQDTLGQLLVLMDVGAELAELNFLWSGTLQLLQLCSAIACAPNADENSPMMPFAMRQIPGNRELATAMGIPAATINMHYYGTHMYFNPEDGPWALLMALGLGKRAARVLARVVQEAVELELRGNDVGAAAATGEADAAAAGSDGPKGRTEEEGCGWGVRRLTLAVAACSNSWQAWADDRQLTRTVVNLRCATHEEYPALSMHWMMAGELLRQDPSMMAQLRDLLVQCKDIEVVSLGVVLLQSLLQYAGPWLKREPATAASLVTAAAKACRPFATKRYCCQDASDSDDDSLSTTTGSTAGTEPGLHYRMRTIAMPGHAALLLQAFTRGGRSGSSSSTRSSTTSPSSSTSDLELQLHAVCQLLPVVQEGCMGTASCSLPCADATAHSLLLFLASCKLNYDGLVEKDFSLVKKSDTPGCPQFRQAVLSCLDRGVLEPAIDSYLRYSRRRKPRRNALVTDTDNPGGALAARAFATVLGYSLAERNGALVDRLLARTLPVLCSSADVDSMWWDLSIDDRLGLVSLVLAGCKMDIELWPPPSADALAGIIPGNSGPHTPPDMHPDIKPLLDAFKLVREVVTRVDQWVQIRRALQRLGESLYRSDLRRIQEFARLRLLEVQEVPEVSLPRWDAREAFMLQGASSASSASWGSWAMSKAIAGSGCWRQDCPVVAHGQPKHARHQLRASPASPKVIVISGPSGVGKDAVIKRLQELRPQLHFVVTATSRAKRAGEVEGVDYFFVSKEKFRAWIDAGELLEHALVYGDYKGIPRAQVDAALARNTDVVLRLDVQGAAAVRGLIPGVVSIFLVAESEAELVARLVARKTEPLDKMLIRVLTARQEAKHVDEFDYVVVNQDGKLDDCVDQIGAIIDVEKLRVHRTKSMTS